MTQQILLQNILLPPSSQWQGIAVDLLMGEGIIFSVAPKNILQPEKGRDLKIIEGDGRVVLPGFIRSFQARPDARQKGPWHFSGSR